jgi:asparagine synthase (glutamine-hydrolysing)
MSTLAVVVDWDNDPARSELARRMAMRVSHRSPDGIEVALAPGAALGFGKLVVSRKQGHGLQPLAKPEAGLFLVADVRIDNRDELRATLAARREATDADLVLAAYEKWGVLAPDHLIGDFAFVVWDARRRQLFAARDAFGIRPLVFRVLGSRLLVASDVEQILEVDRTAFKVDEHAVVDHLLWQWRSAARTFWEPIKAVPPGHCLVARRAGEAWVHRWWRPKVDPTPLGDREACIREFRRLFFRAVEDRLESDHPALIHVSGGFDSSSIASVADRLLRAGSVPASLKAVGAVHPDLSCDESHLMEGFRAHLSYPVEFWDGTKPSLDDLDRPALAGPGYRQWMTNGTAGDVEVARREGARVILSGTGGEIFETTGVIFYDYLMNGSWSDLVDTIAAVRELPRSRWRPYLTAAARFLVPPGMDGWVQRSLRGGGRSRAQLPPWLTSYARGFLADQVSDAGAPGGLTGATRIRTRALAAAAGARAVRSTEVFRRCAAEAGVEARFPFLDQRCLGFALRLPLGEWGAPLYRYRYHGRALADILPRGISQLRSKIVFSDALWRRMLVAAGRLRSLLSGPRIAPYVLTDQLSAILPDPATGGPRRGTWRDWNAAWLGGSLEAWLAAWY